MIEPGKPDMVQTIRINIEEDEVSWNRGRIKPSPGPSTCQRTFVALPKYWDQNLLILLPF